MIHCQAHLVVGILPAGCAADGLPDRGQDAPHAHLAALGRLVLGSGGVVSGSLLNVLRKYFEISILFESNLGILVS